MHRTMLAAAALALCAACAFPLEFGGGTVTAPGCIERAVSAVTVFVADVAGNRVAGVGGVWRDESGQAGECDRLGNGVLSCAGVAVSTSVTIDLSALGFEPVSHLIEVLPGECLQNGKSAFVTMPGRPGPVPDGRRYAHAMFASPDECARSQQASPGIVCDAEFTLCPDGRARLVLLQQVNSGTYDLRSPLITTKWSAPRDVPEKVVFKIQDDGTLGEDLRGWEWQERPLPIGACD